MISIADLAMQYGKKTLFEIVFESQKSLIYIGFYCVLSFFTFQKHP